MTEPCLTAEMAREILTEGTWQTVNQSRALNAIASGETVCVPVTPTPAMILAMIRTPADSFSWPKCMYRAMLQAAQESGKVEGVRDAVD